MRPIARLSSTSVLLPALTVTLAIATFILDTVTRLEIAAAVSYVAVVLLSVNFCSRRNVVFVSLGCVGLTLLSYVFTHGGSYQSGVINSLISIGAIGVTTYLALQMEAARAAAQQAQAQLARVTRITALGELAASIAHEVNQPLSAIVANENAAMNWLVAQPPNIPEVKQILSQIADDANRASAVIAQVRRFVAGAPPQREPVDINDAIEEVAALMQHEIKRNGTTLRMQLSDTLPPTLGDRVQLQQVIFNLIVNAIEAQAATDWQPREILVVSDRYDSRHIRISVSDSGKGFDAQNNDRLFDAFHTTKPQGMGMGLTISRSIVESHGGRIEAMPNNPCGARIQFTLPIDTAGK